MDAIKQVVGIDISKDTLVVCYGVQAVSQDQAISRSATFSNDRKGHSTLLHWALKVRRSKQLELWFIMEATGVYYENLAYFLSAQKQRVVVLLPNKTKNYVRTLNTKTKTDPVDARMLTQYGLERPLSAWDVPSPILKDLKSLTREYQTVQQMLTRIRNQQHAKDNSYAPLKETLGRLQLQIRLLTTQQQQIKDQMLALVQSDPTLHEKTERIARVNGLGIMTVLTIVAETNGFAIIENGKQLASYAGLDVVQNQSGLHRGKTVISKKGNKFLRHAVYMPAMASCRYNSRFKQFYERLIQHNKPKKAAMTAVSRKLLILVYTLWKSDAEYIPNYQNT